MMEDFLAESEVLENEARRLAGPPPRERRVGGQARFYEQRSQGFRQVPVRRLAPAPHVDAQRQQIGARRFGGVNFISGGRETYLLSSMERAPTP